ncbi:MAG: putative manganese-dependent inorganic diphosphatase [Clostridiaceae bacterium]
MKDIIYVTGHKNPDSDSIGAAYAYAEFKNKTGDLPAVPVRLGNVNQETQFILDYFGVEKPMYLETVKLKIEDLHFDRFTPFGADISIKTAWNIMKEKNMKSVPVVDKNTHLIGILSVSNIVTSLMEVGDNNILAESKATLDNIVDSLSAKPLTINEKVKEFPGKILVAAMKPQGFKEYIKEGDVIIIGGDRAEALDSIIDCNISLLILTGSYILSDELLQQAEEKGLTVISTPHDSFTASRLVVQSIPVDFAMSKEDLITMSTEDLVDDIKSVMAETRFRNYPVIDTNNRVVGTVSRFHLIPNFKKKIIQVDHNERGQSVHGLEDAEILEIIDHHRVADIQTGNPIYFRNEPVGSTSTIVAKRFLENGITPSKESAGLLCGAIISDTLLFRSPTCTEIDITICKKLADIAGIELEKFAKEMFKAGTSLKGKTVDEIFNQDYKPFTIEDTKLGVAQVNTMDIEGFMPLKEEMLQYMEKKAKDNDLDLVVLLLTDILNEGSQILVVGSRPDIVENAFKVTLKDNTAFLPGVLSRKKQVIPPFTNVITA